MVFVVFVLHVTRGTQVEVVTFDTFPAETGQPRSATDITGDAGEVNTWNNQLVSKTQKANFHSTCISMIIIFYELNSPEITLST